MKKKLLILLIGILCLALAGCGAGSEGNENGDKVPEPVPSGETSEPADGNLFLIRSVTVYAVDFETGEWTEDHRVEYTYEEGYPLTKSTIYPFMDKPDTVYFEYTFEGGLPSLMHYTGSEGTSEVTREYRNGRPWEENSVVAGVETRRVLYQYGGEDGYYFTVLLSDMRSCSEELETGYAMEEIDSIAVTTENGLLRKTVNSGLYANWNEDEEKEWMRFNGTYTVLYDGDGFAYETSAVFRAGPEGGKDLFELTKENGLVTEAVHLVQDPGGEPYPMERYVFEYTDIPTDAVRYASMINSHIMGEASNFYRYFWY